MSKKNLKFQIGDVLVVIEPDGKCEDSSSVHSTFNPGDILEVVYVDNDHLLYLVNGENFKYWLIGCGLEKIGTL